MNTEEADFEKVSLCKWHSSDMTGDKRRNALSKKPEHVISSDCESI